MLNIPTWNADLASRVTTGCSIGTEYMAGAWRGGPENEWTPFWPFWCANAPLAAILENALVETLRQHKLNCFVIDL